jgi:hypothetical protein
LGEERGSPPPKVNEPGRRAAASAVEPWLVRLVFLLDQAVRVPGTRWRVGLDPIIGLLPGGGDALGALLSAGVVLAAARHGVPRIVLARMVFNIGVDALIGAVPLAGDLFDFAWKANTRNLRLLEAHASGRRRPGWRDWLWAWALLGVLALLLAGVVALGVLAVRAAGFGLV